MQASLGASHLVVFACNLFPFMGTLRFSLTTWISSWSPSSLSPEHSSSVCRGMGFRRTSLGASLSSCPPPVTALTPPPSEVGMQARAKVKVTGSLDQVTEPFYPQCSYLYNGENEITPLLCLLEDEMSEFIPASEPAWTLQRRGGVQHPSAVSM